ncbi:unnamed protein product [Lactuca saligna]|uniref:Uncharacterized protein n=1 Tax=Lactuca saligna TaxID=75948 RepID=A0AA35VAN0_LACSI|nr:unnamed protein product [Lactuca saligna]
MTNVRPPLLPKGCEDINHHTDYQTFKRKWGLDPWFETLDRKDREALLRLLCSIITKQWCGFSRTLAIRSSPPYHKTSYSFAQSTHVLVGAFEWSDNVYWFFTGYTEDHEGKVEFITGKTSVKDAMDGVIKIFTVAVAIVYVAVPEGLPLVVAST